MKVLSFSKTDSECKLCLQLGEDTVLEMHYQKHSILKKLYRNGEFISQEEEYYEDLIEDLDAIEPISPEDCITVANQMDLF